MYFLRKTDQLLFDGGEDELENEWSFVSDTGKHVSISPGSFIDSPLNSLEQHLSEADFKQLIDDLNARKSDGIIGNYCNEHGLELYWLMKVLNGKETCVIVSFGEINPGRYRLVVDSEVRF